MFLTVSAEEPPESVTRDENFAHLRLACLVLRLCGEAAALFKRVPSRPSILVKIC